MGILCVASQTPLIQFVNPNVVRSEVAIDLSTLTEGVDFRFSPGGVSRMLYPLLTRMVQSGLVDGVEWISLNPDAPARVSFKGINLNHVTLPQAKLKGYGAVKEGIWRLFHGLWDPEFPEFYCDEYIDYMLLNIKFSELAYALHRQLDFDAFYIHDFQLLPMGSMLPTAEPKIFRWHIPLRTHDLPKSWQLALLKYLSYYDAVIVSCRSYLDELRRLGYEGDVFHVYPYIDPSQYTQPSYQQIRELRDRLGINEEDKVLLTVARLDPVKAQDKVIKALKSVVSKFPNTKLVLVGDGSFSSSKLGLSKGERWLRYLKECVENMELKGNVIFAGYLSEADLRVAYAMCDVFILPSIREGFGLVVIEAWLYKKPVIVSSYAGVAELIEDGVNGLLFNPKDTNQLASKIIRVLSDEDLAEKLGEEGFKTSRLCHIDEGIKEEAEILSKYSGGVRYAIV
jgi:glycosyltransferase involved in cell wall biosynthesis